MLKSKLFLSLLSGVLLSLSWPTYGIPILIFFAFVPLFVLEEQLNKSGKKHLLKLGLFTYLAMFIWNLATTWWIWNSTAFGAIMAIILNALFMSFVWVLYGFSKKYFKHTQHIIYILPLYWVAFEYLHLDWDLSWSWLNLGNVFANHPQLIQWYEYTGTLGGSWWIIIINILVYKLLLKLPTIKRSFLHYLLATFPLLLWVFVPIISSQTIYSDYQEKGQDVEVVVVQPNMDPWSEQFTSPPQEVIHRIIKLATPLLTDSTAFLIAPESAIQEGLRDPPMSYASALGKKGVSIPMLQAFLKKYPHLRLVIGASTYKFLEEPTETSRTTSGGSIYDEYNTALLMSAQEVEDVYHKSKLVPGPEKMPFKKLLSPIQNIAFDLGGTVGSLGYDKQRKVFYSDSLGVAPLICYESIYGGFVTEFVRNGAQLLFIITNDGWWGNTQGHQQHLAYARLRAVECRRSIARSANTGISGFINQRGDLIDTTAYWKLDARKQSIKAQSELSFYAQYGDYFGRISVFVAVLTLLISLSMKLRTNKHTKNETYTV